MSLLLKPRKSFKELNITEEEWNTIVSAREEGDISFQDLDFNDYDLIIDETNSKLYYSVVQSSSSKFTPLVSFMASTAHAKMAILNDEITEDKIQNNHAFQVLLYNDDTYHIYRLYCTSFPMVNIVYNEQDKKDNFNIPMSMYVFNNSDNGINRIVRSDGTVNEIEMEDGTTNYTFSLTMTTTGNKERENVISLFNMRPSNEYFLNVINTGENDSPIRDNMKFPMGMRGREDFSGDMPNGFFGELPMNRNGRNEQRVELFVNNEYIGLYSLSYNPDVRIRPRNQ